MGLPRKERYFFLCDKNGHTISLQNGAIVPDAMPTPLPESPSGWNEIEIAFGTNTKYWSLNRSFTIPLKFVGDGAEILRYYIYKGKGYEEEIYIRILRWNSLFVDPNGKEGRYELEYVGKIDFTKMIDDPVSGVTVNTIEGGVLSYLNANESVTYEIPCNATNPDCIKVQFDGVELFDRYKFSFLDIDLISNHLSSLFTIPISFLSKEGDSVGIITGSPSYEEISTSNLSNPPASTEATSYVSSSSNYFFASATASTHPIKGKIQFQKTSDQNETIEIFIKSSTGTTIVLYAGVITEDNKIIAIDIDETLTFEPNEKYFLLGYIFGGSISEPLKIKFFETELNITTTTVNTPSISYAMQPLKLGKQLVGKMTDGRYTMESSFFTVHNNIVAAGGEAIRELPDAVLKTSFQDYFNSYNAIYNLGMKVVDNVIWIEPKADLYNDSSEIFDLGEVSKFTIGYAEEYFVNTVKVGYPVQDYGERNGRFEFNDTIQEKLPVTAVNKELNLVSKYRGDSYGIEFNRGALNNKDTTDNKGDNEVFLINVDTSAATQDVALSLTKDAADNVTGTIAFDNVIQATGGVNSFVSYDTFKTTFTYINATSEDARISFNAYGTKAGGEASFILYINDVVITSALVNDFQTTFRVSLNAQQTLNQNDVIKVAVTMSVNLTGAGLDILVLQTNPVLIYGLKRETYDSITGVPTSTVYNIEEMTPKRMLMAHGNYLRSLLYQLPGDKITFQTADKNKDLSTTLGTQTITENADTIVGQLPAPLFLPFEITLTTKVPFSFASIMNRITTGHMRATYNGFPIYLLPIGEMKCRPVNDEAQEWKLLASPINSLDTLLKLSQGATIIQDYMENQIIISDLNPVHFNKYDYKTPSKYHFKGMYDDRFEARLDRYDDKAVYYQKWQSTDVINLQFITVGYGSLEVQVYDCNKTQIAILSPTISADSSLQSPYIKQEFSIDLSTLETGIYQIAVAINGTYLLISEWQQVSEDLPNTGLIEYYHTKNKPDAYFKTWTPAIRIEMFMPMPTPESTSDTYEDEPGDTELLSGTSYMKQKFLFGDGFGIPDYLAKKLNRILLLNKVFIEGIEYTKVGDARLETVELVEGYPMNYYTVEMRESINNMSLVVSDIEMNNVFSSTLTLDAEAFGGAPGTIQIEID